VAHTQDARRSWRLCVYVGEVTGRSARRIAGCVFRLVWYASSLRALDPHKLLTQYSRSVWNQEQGLPQDTVHRITQTSGAYLWIGTVERLARFDGYEFVFFDQEHAGLPQIRSQRWQPRATVALGRHTQRPGAVPGRPLQKVHYERSASGQCDQRRVSGSV
jgi:hypothetical protein